MNNHTVTASFAACRIAPQASLQQQRPVIASLVASLTRTRAIAAAAAILPLVFCAAAAQAEPIDNWTKVTVAADVIKSPSDVIFAGGKFVAVGGAGKTQYSTDGSSWTVVQTPATDNLSSIAYGNGLYVAVGGHRTIISSPDAVTWTVRQQILVGPSAGYSQVVFENGKFVAVATLYENGDYRGEVCVSTNGIDWTPVNTNTANPRFGPAGVTYGKGTYVAGGAYGLTGNTGAYNAMTSPDGVTWTKRYVPFFSEFDAVCYGNDIFVAAGLSFIATSPDGITWTKLSVPFKYSNTSIRAIKFINGRFILHGSSGTLASSLNGTDWTFHTTGTTADISSLAYNDDRLLLFRYSIVSSGQGPWKSDVWAPVVVTPPPGGSTITRIENISTRGWVGVDATKLISGFVIQGATPKKVLIRAVGPTLGAFGVQGTLADPQLHLLTGAGAEVATNNDWGTNANVAEINNAASAVFAFALPAASKDAVILTTLQPGNYTIQISGVGNTTGIALAEVYDVDAPGTCRLVNISSRGFVGTGDSVTIPGFIVSGNAAKKLLIRGVGPTLSAFGVPGVLHDPKIEIYNSSQAKVAENDNWTTFADQAALNAATSQVFAFALSAGSLDAATLVTLQPGAYTVVVSGNAGGTGVGLVEVYEVP